MNNMKAFNLKQYRPVWRLVLILTLFCSQYCFAETDLDDGISKYQDDSIEKWDELGKKSVNINFVIAEALGRINYIDEKDIIQNSVVVGAGANVGDIYNINLNDNGIPIVPIDENNE